MAVVLAEKEAQWAQMIKYCRGIVDKRGRSIDEKCRICGGSGAVDVEKICISCDGTGEV